MKPSALALEVRDQEPIQALVWMTFSAFFFSLMSFFVKKLSTSVPEFELIFFRAFVNFLIVLAWMKMQGERFIPSRKEDRKLLVGRGLAGFGSLVCLFYGLAHLPLAIATLINWSSPLFVILFSRILINERISARSLFWVCFAFIGLILLLIPDFRLKELALPIGAVGITVCGAAFGALAYVAVRAATARIGANGIILYFTGVSALLSLPFAFTGKHQLTSPEFVQLILMGVFACLGQYTMTQGYRLAAAGLVSSMGLLNPVFATVWGWFILGETLTWVQSLGMLWLGTGILFVVQSSRR